MADEYRRAPGLPGRQPPADPPRSADDPPPLGREQLPLPRRARQAHLEPQLRLPGGTGNGTPFTAFTTDATDDTDDADTTPVERAAEFHEATRRSRGRPAS